MRLSLVVGQATDPGRVRETNEDNFCTLVYPQVVQDFDALLAVADGMGGHQAGEVASKYVADTLRDLFVSAKYRTWVDFSPEREDYIVLVLKEVMERINDKLYQMAVEQQEWHGMGTTATIALVADGKLYIGHVGDSRAYLQSDGNLRLLTKDHSWVMEQVDQGAMEAGQAANDPRKNQITRALGVNALIKVDRIIQELHPGDMLLLCTDGLTNMVNEAEMASIMQFPGVPHEICAKLVRLANDRGGGDNITVVVARVYAPEPNVRAMPGAEMAEGARFSLHDTQPLGPVRMMKTEVLANGSEPVRMNPPSSTPGTFTVTPKGRASTGAASQANGKAILLASSEAGDSPGTLSGARKIPGDLSARPVDTATAPAAQEAAVKRQERGIRLSLSIIAAIVVYATTAAILNGLFTFILIHYSPEFARGYVAVGVGVATGCLTAAGVLLFSTWFYWQTRKLDLIVAMHRDS